MILDAAPLFELLIAITLVTGFSIHVLGVLRGRRYKAEALLLTVAVGIIVMTVAIWILFVIASIVAKLV